MAFKVEDANREIDVNRLPSGISSNAVHRQQHHHLPRTRNSSSKLLHRQQPPPPRTIRMDGLIKLIFLLVQKPTIVFHSPKNSSNNFLSAHQGPFLRVN